MKVSLLKVLIKLQQNLIWLNWYSIYRRVLASCSFTSLFYVNSNNKFKFQSMLATCFNWSKNSHSVQNEISFSSRRENFWTLFFSLSPFFFHTRWRSNFENATAKTWFWFWIKINWNWNYVFVETNAFQVVWNSNFTMKL